MYPVISASTWNVLDDLSQTTNTCGMKNTLFVKNKYNPLRIELNPIFCYLVENILYLNTYRGKFYWLPLCYICLKNLPLFYPFEFISSCFFATLTLYQKKMWTLFSPVTSSGEFPGLLLVLHTMLL